MSDLSNSPYVKRIICDLLHRHMAIVLVGPTPMTFCGCGYTAEIDWNDAEFGEAHNCNLTQERVLH